MSNATAIRWEDSAVSRRVDTLASSSANCEQDSPSYSELATEICGIVEGGFAQPEIEVATPSVNAEIIFIMASILSVLKVRPILPYSFGQGCNSLGAVAKGTGRKTWVCLTWVCHN